MRTDPFAHIFSEQGKIFHRKLENMPIIDL